MFVAPQLCVIRLIFLVNAVTYTILVSCEDFMCLYVNEQHSKT